MRSLSLVLLFLALTACTPVAGPTPAPVAPTPVVLSSDPAACQAAGGAIRRVCMMGKPSCVIAYSDAGKACTNSGQCQGRCLADDGYSPKAPGPVAAHCEPDSDRCGCATEVIGGQAQATLCID